MTTRQRIDGRWLLLTPYLLGSALLIGLPAVILLGLVFFRYDGLSAPLWNGIQNFRDVAVEPLFWIALNNSLYFVVLAVPLRLLAALGLALLLAHPRRGVGLARAAVYLPTVIPETAYALLWLWLLNPLYGPINLLLGALQLPAPAWLLNPATAKPALVFMALFTIGEGFVMLLAARRDISQDYFHAAQVDGASRWQLFRYITLPLLAPWLVLLTFRDVIITLQNTFTPAYVMTGGDPYYATLFLPLLVYEEAFDGLRFGQSSVMMLALLLVCVGLVTLLYLLFEGWGSEET